MSRQRPTRISIEFNDLYQRIQDCQKTYAWKNMSFSAKVRTLVEMSLSKLEEENRVDTIANLVQENWEHLMSTPNDLTVRRLIAIRDGDRPTDEELVELGMLLDPDVHELAEIRDRQFRKVEGKQKYGGAASKVKSNV